jgi:RND family efflux transporter MFP subunit
MKKFVSLLVFLTCAGVLGTQIYWKVVAAKKGTEQRRRGSGTVAVELAPVRKMEIRKVSVFTGSLFPRAEFKAAPKISGRLNKLLVDVGDVVQRDQLIALMDDAEPARQVEQAAAEVPVAKAGAEEVRLNAELQEQVYAQEVAQAEAELDFAKASAEEIRLNALLDERRSTEMVAQAKSDLATAQARLQETQSRMAAALRELNRVKALREKKIVSDSDLDQSQSAYAASRAQNDAVAGALSEKQAALKVAQLGLSETQLQARQAKNKFALAQVAQKEAALKASQVLMSETQSKARKAKHQLALSHVSEKQAALKTAEVRLSYTRIKASWGDEDESRVVGERFVDEGDRLTANAAIVSILDLRSVIAVIYVVEKQQAHMRIGQDALLTTDAFPRRKFSGKVVRVAPLLRQASRQGRVEIEVLNADRLLKPGMFVRAEIELERHTDATTVPEIALVKRDDRQGVFVADTQNMKANFQPLEVGIISDRSLSATCQPFRTRCWIQ